MTPALSNPTAALAAAIDDVVVANRILAMHGVLDAFGHVSVRHPDAPGRFVLARSMAPEMVTADDLLVFDLDSNPLGGDPRKPYLERFIHGAVYKARPDVMAVVHSHSPSIIPFAASSVRLRPIYHMASFLGQGAPVFDIRQHCGCTDMLVRNNDQGAALARTLGASNVSLMRGHGFITTGTSVPMAVYRAIYAETNAALQQKAIGLGGELTYLEADEAAAADATNMGVLDKPWDLWKKKAVAQMGR